MQTNLSQNTFPQIYEKAEHFFQEERGGTEFQNLLMETGGGATVMGFVFISS